MVGFFVGPFFVELALAAKRILKGRQEGGGKQSNQASKNNSTSTGGAYGHLLVTS